jgi:hypothetical protein
MPKFYFHLRDGTKLKRDKRGMELPDIKAALQEGERIARQMIESGSEPRRHLEDKQIEVVDAKGAFLFRLPLKFDFI